MWPRPLRHWLKDRRIRQSVERYNQKMNQIAAWDVAEHVKDAKRTHEYVHLLKLLEQDVG